MFHQEDQILLTVRSSKTTMVSMIKPNGITNTSTFLQGLFLPYLHEAVITIVSLLQLSLPVSLYDNVLCYLYKVISTVVSLISSLLQPLRSKFLQLSLLTSRRSEFLQSSLLISLRR